MKHLIKARRNLSGEIPLTAIPVFVFFGAFCLLFPAWAADDWLQWGGPNGDFTVDVKGLAKRWPQGGPKLLWKRPLGDGYSSILYKDNRLFTMYRSGNEEVIVSLDARTGETIWEHRSEPELWPDMLDFETSFTRGPNATPLIVDDLLVCIGIVGMMRCLDLATGDRNFQTAIRLAPDEAGFHLNLSKTYQRIGDKEKSEAAYQLYQRLRSAFLSSSLTLCIPLALIFISNASGTPPTFVDVTSEAGITFKHENGATGAYYLPETLGAGGAFLDYDKDADLDLFLVNSGSLNGQQSATIGDKHALSEQWGWHIYRCYRHCQFANDDGIRSRRGLWRLR